MIIMFVQKKTKERRLAPNMNLFASSPTLVGKGQTIPPPPALALPPYGWRHIWPSSYSSLANGESFPVRRSCSPAAPDSSSSYTVGLVVGDTIRFLVGDTVGLEVGDTDGLVVGDI